MQAPSQKWHVRAKLQSFATGTFGSRIHPELEVPMKKYVIERPMPRIGSLTRDELHAGATRSCVALDELGPDIQWVHSYVTDDKIYCVYIAPDAAAVREHAKRGGFPANNVSQVRHIIDPTTSELTGA
jgi:hypothetical protein